MCPGKIPSDEKPLAPMAACVESCSNSNQVDRVKLHGGMQGYKAGVALVVISVCYGFLCVVTWFEVYTIFPVVADGSEEALRA